MNRRDIPKLLLVSFVYVASAYFSILLACHIARN